MIHVAKLGAGELEGGAEGTFDLYARPGLPPAEWVVIFDGDYRRIASVAHEWVLREAWPYLPGHIREATDQAIAHYRRLGPGSVTRASDAR